MCGHYAMGRLAQPNVERPDFPIPRHILSGITRNYWEVTGQPFEITNEMVETTDALIASSPVPIPQPDDVERKADLILAHLKRRSSHLGAQIDCTGSRTVGFCQNDGEFRFCMEYLVQRQLVENIVPPRSHAITYNYRITPNGWIYLAGVGADKPDQGFIAMSFRPELDPLWHNGIEEGIKAAGYSPLRIDRKEHNNRIDDEIVAEIRKSRFIVTDLTGQNPGAYFEAGFAMGLGKPVIWTCRDDEVADKKVHFDTRQYSIVTWPPEQFEDFARRLSLRIQATIGPGPLKTDKPAPLPATNGGG
jgi:hypothetical protein